MRLIPLLLYLISFSGAKGYCFVAEKFEIKSGLGPFDNWKARILCSREDPTLKVGVIKRGEICRSVRFLVKFRLSGDL